MIGAAIGYLSFRSGLRGSYFALVTLAFAEVFRIVANAAETTGGAAGMLIRLDVRPSNFQFGSRAAFFWIALALVALTLALTRWIERSRFGARLVAIRENEEAAQALGVDTLRTKLAAIALSGAVTGAAGCLYAQYFLFIDANIAYGTWISVEALLAPIIGGAGTAFGPLVGALALHGLGEATKLGRGPRARDRSGAVRLRFSWSPSPSRRTDPRARPPARPGPPPGTGKDLSDARRCRRQQSASEGSSR